MKPVAKIISLAAASIVLMTTTATRAAAQNADDDAESRRACRSAVGSERRRCESESETPADVALASDESGRSDARLRVRQIREDLVYLRTAADYISRAASQSGGLDFKAVAKSASEVRRRAGRLKDSLSLPTPRKGEEYGEQKALTDEGELRAALSSLSSLLSDAVRSPALRGYLLDVTKAFEASSKLDAVVELSGRIKAGSETFVKNGR